MRVALTCAAVAITAFVLAVLAPVREISGDTVPGRIGGAVLRCAGTFDLSRVDWVRAETSRDRVFYWLHPDQVDEYTSIFGPAPAVIGALALPDFGDGDAIADVTLRKRERYAGALLVALAAALLTVAAAAHASLPRSALTGGVAVLAFCGAATLGQALWQATTALPCLVGALATLAWRARRPRVALLTPALLVVAVMLRPTIAPLALGLGLTWALPTRDVRTWLVATALALAAVAPLVAWNAIHLWSPLPLGQWQGNKQMTETVFSIANVPGGVAGLVASPARGLVWFAPIVIVGVVAAARTSSWRLIAAGIVLQLVVMACFFKWHGGQAYGPRLVAEASWLGIWLALGAGVALRRAWLVPTIAVTIIVGQLGLWWWTPEQWEARRFPESHPGAFWDFVDSPIASTLAATPKVPLAHDAPPTNGLRCEGDKLRSY